MLHNCYGKLSRGIYARPASRSCKEKYFLAMASPMPSTHITRVLSSLTSTSPLPSPSFNSPRPLYLHLMHVAAADQRMIHNKPDKHVQVSCSEILSRASRSKLDCTMPLEKVFNGSALQFQRPCGRMFSSFSSRAKRVNSVEIVVVVESPVKAKAVQSFLGTDFVVLPSHGHVRDLAARAGSVRPEDDYAMLWEVPEAAQPHVLRIKNACESAKRLLIATDPDREGEALAWHVVQVMKAEGLFKNGRLRVQRVLFNEVTKSVVLHAIQSPQNLRAALVDAYLAGRALDHLVGFALSPLLWRKLAGSGSAGRVHLAALQLVCEREDSIKKFVPQQFWTLDVCACMAEESVSFLLTPILINGDKTQESCHFPDMAKCLALAEKIENSTLKVSKTSKNIKRRDQPEPYITSTLQEDAQALLGFAAEKTMTLAQKLYEGVNLGKGEWTGLITSPRSNGILLSKEAARGIRACITQRYGDDYISSNAREFESYMKNTSAGQEAIRPTNMRKVPSALSEALDKDALALYTLIWKRTVESQMQQAMYEEVSVDFVTEAEDVCLRATFSHLTFPGFLAASVDKEMSSCLEPPSLVYHLECHNLASESWDRVSALKEGDAILIKKAKAHGKSTSAPVRFSEGLLVKAMAEAGIGRPSTYASLLKSLKAKKYVKYENQQIVPEVQGLMVSVFLSQCLPKFVDGNMTAQLEKQLDEVSCGRMQWKKVLREFWPSFNAEVSSAMNLRNFKVAKVLNEALDLGLKGRSCSRCGTGKLLLKEKRSGRGYYLGCDRYPMCGFKKALAIDDEDANTQAEPYVNLSAKIPEISLGVDPTTDLEVMVRTGPWGTYIQLGGEAKGLACFALPHFVNRDDITLEKALQLMKYPLELGKHPEDGHAVILGLSNKSYVVTHRSIRAELPKDENVEEITLERALHLLKGGRSIRGNLAAMVNVGRGAKKECEAILSQQVESLEVSSYVNVAKEKKEKKKEVEGKEKKPIKRKAARFVAGKEAKKHLVAGNVADAELDTNKGKDTASEVHENGANDLYASAR